MAVMTTRTPLWLRQLPNIITGLRILGVVLIFWLTPYKTNYWLLMVAELYTLVSLTDFLDGWIARKYKVESYLGKVLDPLADKILVLVFLPLLEMQVITAFPVFIILVREFSIMALRILAAKEEQTIVTAQFSGKLKTGLTLPVCGILLGRVPVETVESLPWFLVPYEYLRLWVITWPNYVINLMIYAVVFVTIWSFFTYFNSFIWQKLLSRFKGDEEAVKRSIRCLIPNFFSLLNLVSGVLAIAFSIDGSIDLAVLFILIGILADSLDGSLARRLDAYSKFGERLDTKADFMTFGVAPGVLIYAVLQDVFALWIVLALVALYVIAVVFRLWRFSQSGHGATFDGLPSPIGAGLLLFAVKVDFLYHEYLFVAVLIYVALMMVSTFTFPHLSELSKVPFNRKVRKLLTVLTAVSMMVLVGFEEAAMLYPFDLVFVIVILYSLRPIFGLFSKKGA